MPEEIFVAQLRVGSRAEGRSRQAELEAQAARWFGAAGSVWLGTEVVEEVGDDGPSGYRVRARYRPGPAALAAAPPPGGLQRAARWLGLVERPP